MSSRDDIRVAFVDFWKDFDIGDNFVLDALRRRYDVRVVSNRPDVLFYSVFGNRNSRFLGKKILINGEPISTRHGWPDFTIGFHEATSHRKLRLPVWAWDLRSELLLPSSAHRPSIGERFCSFVFSNAECEFRNRFYVSLNRRKPVDSLGSVFESVRSVAIDPRMSETWHESKILALSTYRFNIAFENTSLPGYSTEKLVDSFLAGTVPIYWGDPFIAEDFNPEAFVDVSRFSSPHEAIERVLEIENDPSQLKAIRDQPPMSKEQFERYSSERLSQFLVSCLESPRPPKRSQIARMAAGMIPTRFQPGPGSAVRKSLRRML